MSRFERVLLHLSTMGAALTGGLYFWMKFLLRGDDPYSVVHHPWQPSVLALHVLVVPVLVFALGLIAREHVIGRFLERRSHRSRRSGVAAALLIVPMIVSGYLLQVFTDLGSRRIVALAHAAAGGFFALAYLLHFILARPPHAVVGARPVRRRRRRAPQGRLDWSRALGLKSFSRPEANPPQSGSGWRRT